MSKAGPILGLIGGILLVVGSMLHMLLNSILNFIFYGLAPTEADLGLELTWITVFVTLGIGVASIVISSKMKKGKLKEKASLILLILGVIAAIGLFIEFLPERSIDTGTGMVNTFVAITLTTTLLFIDPYLIIMGGVVDLLAVPPEIIAEAKDKNKV
ncbi:MAG: hypothetical protein ACTSP9_07445 [Promethearchaeota archaeon]